MDPSENLYIQGLPLDIDDERLKAIFNHYGSVAQCKVLEPVPGKGDTVALLRMGSLEEAKWIVEHVHQNIPMGLEAPLSVAFSRNKAQKEVDMRKAAGIPPPAQSAAAGFVPPIASAVAAPPPPGSGGGQGLQLGVMLSGAVKRWDSQKGFGFIVPDGGGPDVFVHIKDLSDGEVLVNGAQVMFEAMLDVSKGPGKYRAKNCIGGVPKEVASSVASDRLFMTGFPGDTPEETITAVFSQYGTVVSVKKLPPTLGKPDAAALVRMGDVAQAKWLVDNVNRNIPSGLQTPITIGYAENKSQLPDPTGAPLAPAAVPVAPAPPAFAAVDYGTDYGNDYGNDYGKATWQAAAAPPGPY
mmetsp:Transcript_5911/g.15767  ORF Transcript_5911/g.15767 Transcript_5911/m.15767 type:complete len:354 (-) Transcript_5911:101-1162(-)|eukprot:CAMPEP_0171235028 /NCGR_PEP_ID=MMETSP0790-20130122/41736_1 /TAXON_ID=2925 /ORGANISM="Alexandrium catenella, Strain OF101" /LENGTH=353 /DNA_ID=CAMNT_0011701329 /DNA_START=59 /DNA_END=1120 /DNA_ORIENTATION=-